MVFPAKPERGAWLSGTTGSSTGEVTLEREGAKLIPLSRKGTGRAGKKTVSPTEAVKLRITGLVPPKASASHVL